MWLLVVYMRTPLSSQPALLTLMFSITVHWASSFLLHMAKAAEQYISVTIVQ